MALANLQWFIDDSGSEPNEVYFVLAGFLSTADRWAAFSDEWQAALSLPPLLDYFKMTEASRLQEQFDRRRGWTDALRDQRVRLLVDIACRHVLLRISGAIQNSHFSRYFRSIPAIGRTLSTDNPYPLLFMDLAARELAFSYRRGFRQPRDYVLDEQHGIDREIGWRWQEFAPNAMRHNRPELAAMVGSPPIFRSEYQFLPLQAADLYAWQVRRNLRRNHKLVAPPTEILRVFSGMPSDHHYFTEAECRRRHRRILEAGARAKAANPALSLVAFPERSQDQKKTRRASSALRKNYVSGRRPT